MKKPAYILGADFFGRKTTAVAKDLVGMYLIRKIGRTMTAWRITDVEAYVGPHDLASHAARGRTRRTEPMFGQPGTLYIYFVYGVHWMLNVVTERPDYPAAILIRGVEGISGPARLTKKLKITGALNNQSATRKTGLWFEDRGDRQNIKIRRGPRIGIDYAGAVWAAKKYRYYTLSKGRKRA